MKKISKKAQLAKIQVILDQHREELADKLQKHYNWDIETILEVFCPQWDYSNLTSGFTFKGLAHVSVEEFVLGMLQLPNIEKVKVGEIVGVWQDLHEVLDISLETPFDEVEKKLH